MAKAAMCAFVLWAIHGIFIKLCCVRFASRICCRKL